MEIHPQKGISLVLQSSYVRYKGRILGNGYKMKCGTFENSLWNTRELGKHTGSIAGNH